MTTPLFEKSILKAKKQFIPTKQVNVYAAIYNKKGNLISESTNSYIKTHPLQKEFAEKLSLQHHIYLHAEIGALIKARGQGHTIHIVRLAKDGQTTLPSKPCPICDLAIRKAHINNIIYYRPERTPNGS